MRIGTYTLVGPAVRDLDEGYNERMGRPERYIDKPTAERLVNEIESGRTKTTPDRKNPKGLTHFAYVDGTMYYMPVDGHKIIHFVRMTPYGRQYRTACEMFGI